MNQKRIVVLNPNPGESDYLANLCRNFGAVVVCPSLESAAPHLGSGDVEALIVDSALAGSSSLKGIVSKATSCIITGHNSAELRTLKGDWPADHCVESFCFTLSIADDPLFLRSLERALILSRTKSENLDLRKILEGHDAKVREVYSEIKEIRGLINESFIRELEKRIAIETKYLWFRREREKVEKILRKIYAANDVSSLLDIITDIKDIVQAGGATIYILDENEPLGKYLKPLVWDDAFLTHPQFAKFIALIDAQDFAASVARLGKEINVTDLAFDKRLSRRYLDHLRTPLKSLMGIPIMHDKEVIGVVEVYNKISQEKRLREGFSKEDQEILRGLSEHIAIAMAKLDLIQYDALTGLLRPDPFFEKVIRKINSLSKRRKEEGSYALVMGDVDWFKNFNDRNGHEAGNKLLRELSGVLKLSIREEDLLCRYGGEEFLFFLAGVKTLEEACVLTDRIRRNVEEHYFEFQEFQPQNNLTMSFGVTIFPLDKQAAESRVTRNDLKILAGEADMAMAEAKGKNLPELAVEGTTERILMKNKVCCYSRAEEDNRSRVIQTYKERSYVEKRKSERYPASTIMMYRENGGFQVTKTVNLSLDGAKILSESKLPLAKTIDLILVLKNRANSLKGDIVYSNKANGESPYYHSGVKFRELTEDDRKALDDYFQGFRKKDSTN